MQNKVQRFETLDGWRGLCALLVALYHLDVYGHFYTVPFVRNSWLFVDFFFVLSGFVISYAYMDKLSSWENVRAFIVRRFGRLWPLHISVLLFLVLLECVKAFLLKSGAEGNVPAFTGERSFEALAANVLLIHALGIFDNFTWNVPSWSISTEFYAYLVFACVFLSMRGARATLVTSMGIAAICAAVVFIFSPNGFGNFRLSFLRTLYGFFTGHLTYRLWRTGFAQQIFNHAWFWEIGILALTIAYISLLPLDDSSDYRFAAPIIFAAVIWIFAHEGGLISRAISTAPVKVLGERSYSMYMVHAPIVLVLDRVIDLLQHHTAMPLRVELTSLSSAKPTLLMFFGNMWTMDVITIVYLIAVVLVAGVTYKFIEHPGRAFFNSTKWGQTKKNSQIPEAAASPVLPFTRAIHGLPVDS